MARKRLLWQLYPSYLLVTLAALVAATLYATRALREFHHDEVAAELRARAHLLMGQIGQLLDANRWEELDRICKELGQVSQTRITVILPGGVVVADSEKDPAGMEARGERQGGFSR